nr:FAD-binding and (Fe-S)-binding domain-containing protein [Halomicroarcula marina]
MYATDASIYEATPYAVAFPMDTDDVATIVDVCADHGIPVLPRGAGTSLAGQTVNEALVLDISRQMDEVISVDPDAKRATAQPGVTLGRLNTHANEYNLKFAPDPAWGDKSTLGGAIGNNSSGAHSLKYGMTDAYVESCEVVLTDGTVTRLGEVPVDELRENADPSGSRLERIYAAVLGIIDDNRDLIERAYPDLKRNVSGYNLAQLPAEADGGAVNIARILAGSEGTLGVVTEATVSLEPVPAAAATSLLCYEDLIDAMRDVSIILDREPAAIEVVDDVLLDLARETAEFADVCDRLPAGTNAALLVEFYGETAADASSRVDGLLADRVLTEGTSTDIPSSKPQYAFDALEATTDAERDKLWKLRKSGLPILLSRTTDEKHIAFIEDTAIPPTNLPDYVEGVQEILDDHGTFAAFYAHAGPGVLHIRPLIDVKSTAGVAQMESIADAVTNLVVEYDGSIAGEHGDGRARTQWNKKQYGEDVMAIFRQVKRAFDPQCLLNPGQVYGDVSLTENLRFGPDYDLDVPFDPTLHWRNDNGFQGMVELCHGCGGCRGDQDTTGGIMCPTFRAEDEEVYATRGRANMLRQALSDGIDDMDVTSDEFVKSVMDHCVGCKGCARDCPSEVDMAKLKAEITHQYHEEHGASLRDHLFANINTVAKLGSRLAPVSNWLADNAVTKRVLERTVGIASDRTLPQFQRRTLRNRLAARDHRLTDAESNRNVVLVPDTFTNYVSPEAGEAAVSVLQSASVSVTLSDVEDLGRPAFSKGMLDVARNRAQQAVDELVEYVDQGYDIVVVEPSDAVLLQEDCTDLLDSTAAERVTSNSYGVCEYLDRFGLDENLSGKAGGSSIAYHGHCHQQAAKRDHHAVAVLRRVGYEVDPLDSTCCGMAGSFGYEAEHAELSRSIGEQLFAQVDDSQAMTVTAPGASCRSQLASRGGDEAKPATPIEFVAEAIE